MAATAQGRTHRSISRNVGDKQIAQAGARPAHQNIV